MKYNVFEKFGSNTYIFNATIGRNFREKIFCKYKFSQRPISKTSRKISRHDYLFIRTFASQDVRGLLKLLEVWRTLPVNRFHSRRLSKYQSQNNKAIASNTISLIDLVV